MPRAKRGIFMCSGRRVPLVRSPATMAWDVMQWP
jgi:hypothetical protein